MQDMNVVVRVLVLFMLFGVPALTIMASLWALRRSQRFTRGATSVVGTVVAVARGSSTTSSGTTAVYSPTFVYQTPDGVAQASVTGASSAYGFPIGSEVEILINPEFPGVARIKAGWPYLLGTIFLVVGVVFAIVGYVAFREL